MDRNPVDKSRRVTGSLLQTNILLMDKNYHQAYLLWNPLKKALLKEETVEQTWETENHLSCDEAVKAYSLYCQNRR